MHNGKKTCSGKIPEPKKDENLILDLLGYYDIKEVITDIARGEADLDTLKAGASLIPVAKITKVPKVVKAIGNVGKTGIKKGKEGEKIAKSGQAKQTKTRDKEGSGNKSNLKLKNNSNSTSYKRPSGYRKGVKKKTWELAVSESQDGEVRSPSGKIIKETDNWHMGHKPGYEFKKHRESAERRGISRKKFLDEHNNPKHYRPELPKDNVSHKYEGPDDLNFWDD